MQPVKVHGTLSDSTDGLHLKALPRCGGRCGMCPSCVFAPRPPGSTERVWGASDEFRRRFLMALILLCKNRQLLESVQSALDVTSWSLFTYARSRNPISPADFPPRTSHRATGGTPSGVDEREIWKWFSRSPDWVKSGYLCRIFTLCNSALLRMASNLVSVLLIRQKQGFLQFDGSRHYEGRHDEDSEDPALMVVLGSSLSVSGVSLYRDFITCLPILLAKRILGLLEEHTLNNCKKVCRSWQQMANETMEEKKLRGVLHAQMMAIVKKRKSLISPTYANVVEILVPIRDDEVESVHSPVQKGMPFQSAYANIRTKPERVEERNVYCGAYFTKVLLAKEDPHRVLDYRGGMLMATGSKDCQVHLHCVGSDVKDVAVLKGHAGSIHAVLLCQDRDLVITASRDNRISCWSLLTVKCERTLYGHTRTVNCLDVYDDRLVSGSRDCHVKVWSLTTGQCFGGLKFKHPSPILCVKIYKSTVCSSCDLGLVKMWSLEKGALLRVINAHRSSVTCLFLDKWHLLSGDASGSVKAWSISSDAKECLNTFNHPMEVKSLTLAHLRVVTGCADGKIRIFNFLTGECLRVITAETEADLILSVHFHDNGILVNTKASVKLYQFAKVFWDYADSVQGGPEDDLSPQKSGSGVASIPDCRVVKPDSAELLSKTHCLAASAKRPTNDVKELVWRSERAASQRIKKRGLHHPLTSNSIALKVNMIQKNQCMDEVGVNTEGNSRLQGSWAPRSDIRGWKQNLHTDEARPIRVSTCVPIPRRDNTNMSGSRIFLTCTPNFDTLEIPKREDGVSKSGAAELKNPKHKLQRSLSRPCSVRFSQI